jgi:hypothetical protein
MQYIVIPVAILVVAGATYLAKITLEKLDTKILPFYEFDLSLPSAGKWSVVFFLIIISILTLVVLLSSSQQITLRPA